MCSSKYFAPEFLASGELNPASVKDAIIECFMDAHAKELQELDHYASDSEELERLKEMNVDLLVRKAFEETGGNFENPTKKEIIKAVEYLVGFSGNFRNQEVVMHNKDKIMKLIKLLP